MLITFTNHGGVDVLRLVIKALRLKPLLKLFGVGLEGTLESLGFALVS